MQGCVWEMWWSKRGKREGVQCGGGVCEERVQQSYKIHIEREREAKVKKNR